MNVKDTQVKISTIYEDLMVALVYTKYILRFCQNCYIYLIYRVN